jgi:hypothetical protein
MLLIAAPLSIALGLAAFAAWTSSGLSQQQITAGGGPQIVLSTTAAGAVVSAAGLTVTLAPFTDAQPTFTTGDSTITVTNSGTTPATLTSATVFGTPGAGANSTALNSQLSICVADVSSEDILYNGLLSAFTGLTGANFTDGDTIAAGGTEGYILNVYAGDSMTFCGTTPAGTYSPTGTDTLSTAPPLTDPAQNGTDNVSLATVWT